MRFKNVDSEKGYQEMKPNLGKHCEQNKSLITFLCLLLDLGFEPRLTKIKGLMKVIK